MKLQMMNYLTYLSIVIMVLINNPAFAETSENLMIDHTVPNSQSIEFPNDEKHFPEKSDFKIIHSIQMSNENGERWATLTLSNTSSGRRIFKPDHILATFANGDYRHPHTGEQPFEANETITLTLYFGKNKFPLIKVATRN